MARSLRKWADLIDPTMNASSELTVRVEVDNADAMKKIAALRDHLETLIIMKEKADI